MKLQQALAQQQRESLSIPFVKTLPPAPVATGVREMKRLLITIAGGTTVNVPFSGDALIVESISILSLGGGNIYTSGSSLAVPVTVKPDTSNVEQSIEARDDRFRFATPYNVLQFRNPTSNPTAYLIVYVGFGDYESGIVRVGPNVFSFTQSLTVTNAAAYAVGQSVGSNGLFTGFFLLGYDYARVIRARIAKTTATLTNADFTLFMFNGDTAPTFTDHAAFALTAANDGCPPIRFPQFITGGAGSTQSFCDIADFTQIMRPGVTAAGRSLYWGLVANAAYTPANPETFRLDIEAEFH